MWRLMIADDEPKIRRGLSKSIQWEEKNIVLAGEAEDGEEALEKARQLQPDIMLVDICMPFMNGLELIDQLRRDLPHCQFIVITGHDEFAYAQQAVKLKVFDFLLKPVVISELMTVIDKAVEALQHDTEQDAYLKWVHRKIDDDTRVLQTQFFKKWLSGSLTEDEVADELRFFNLDLSPHLGMIVVKPIEQVYIDRLGTAWDYDLQQFAVINIMNEFLQDTNPYMVLGVEKGCVTALMAIKQPILWLSLGNQLEQTVEKTCGFSVCVSQMEVTGGIAQVSAAYRDLVKDVNEKSALTPIVQSARKFINHNYDQPDLTLKKLGEELQVSPTYLSKLLKKELGCSFIDYLTRVRIKHAVRYMHDPVSKVYEVAERVGYNSQHYFSLAFKKTMGVSPTSYRKGSDRRRERS